MAFYLAHAGTKLYRVDTAGAALELSLPAGVTISDLRRGRFAILKRNIVMVNAPSVNLQIDPTLIVRPLTVAAPTTPLTAATAGAGALTGLYRYRVTFVVRDGSTVLSESEPSTYSSDVTAASHVINLTAIPVSPSASVNARKIYRTTSGADASYFLLTTIPNNTATTHSDNTADAGLGDELNSDLGTPYGTTDQNRMEVIVTWKDRLWACSSEYPDRVNFSGNLLHYAWNQSNYVTAKPEGEDLEGVTGFATRRDELGVGKRRSLWKIIGTAPSNFQMIRVSNEVGIWAAESPVVIRDEAYFLGEDGVYKWGPGGVTPLSRDKVHPWFTRDDEFNRAEFANAFAKYNQRYDCYELHLCSAGQTAHDRWIAFDLRRGIWLGPHKTTAFAEATCAGVVEDANNLVVPVQGTADGYLYKQNQAAFNDDGDAVSFLAISKKHHADSPDAEKYWGEISVHSKEESQGTLLITPNVGDLNDDGDVISVVSIARGAQDGVTFLSVVTVVTSVPHAFGDYESVTIAGADQSDYNGTHVIRRTGTHSFTFTLLTVTPVTPATGTITVVLPIRSVIEHDLTLDRERLPRLGIGRKCQLEFANAEVDQGVELYGYEIDPVHVIGRR
jgi:hypothetical protein